MAANRNRWRVRFMAALAVSKLTGREAEVAHAAEADIGGIPGPRCHLGNRQMRQLEQIADQRQAHPRQIVDRRVPRRLGEILGKPGTRHADTASQHSDRPGALRLGIQQADRFPYPASPWSSRTGISPTRMASARSAWIRQISARRLPMTAAPGPDKGVM